MKKIELTFLFLALLGFFMTSCSDDFLQKKPSQYISSDQIAEISKINPDLQASNISGLYTTMYATGTGGTTGHDDFGQKGYDIFTDMICGDMVLSTSAYGWYRSTGQFNVTRLNTSNQVYMPWRYYYRIIFAANNIIDALGGADATFSDDEIGKKARHYMGQALGMRGYAYFYLGQLFTPEYLPNELCVPIYRTTTDLNMSRAPQKELYDLVISDLEKAASHLKDFNRTGKHQINQYVAKGLLAYAYASTGEDAKAMSTAKDVIDNGGFTPMTGIDVVYSSENGTGSGFNNVDIPGWIWGVDLTIDIGLNLVSWWGQVDLFTYSYASGDAKSVSTELYNNIRADDVRKGQFQDADLGGGYILKLMPINKFFTPERIYDKQRQVTTDYVYMRVSEMHLLYAECAARSGNESEAKTVLKNLLQDRIADISYIDALSGKALQDEIYLQTRIEFWGEGKSFLAMKRNKATVTMGENHLYYPNDKFAYNSTEMYYKIPENEELNNPNLSGN